jgi:hypothetical protein
LLLLAPVRGGQAACSKARPKLRRDQHLLSLLIVCSERWTCSSGRDSFEEPVAPEALENRDTSEVDYD